MLGDRPDRHEWLERSAESLVVAPQNPRGARIAHWPWQDPSHCLMSVASGKELIHCAVLGRRECCKIGTFAGTANQGRYLNPAYAYRREECGRVWVGAASDRCR